MDVIALEGNGARPSHLGGGWKQDGRMFTLNTVDRHCVCYPIENHPNDSRVGIANDGMVQTLSARCGTGGGNTPLVLILNTPSSNQCHCFRKSCKPIGLNGIGERWVEDDVTNTLNCYENSDAYTAEIIVEV